MLYAVACDEMVNQLEWLRVNRSAVCSDAALLKLLVSLLQGDPGVEHGGTQFGPHQVISQAQDLSSMLGSRVWRQNR